MRNLFFRNVTSDDKRQRILASSEFIEQKGIRSCIHRHLVCRIEEMAKTQDFLPRPALYVFKKRDTRLNIEAFYCRIKGQMYFASKDKIYLVHFINSLRIQLQAVTMVMDK